MKLLQLCVVAAIAAGVATGPQVARAQALGEAAILNAGAASTGSAAGSALGNSIGRAMSSAGDRLASSRKTSTSGGVVNMRWSRKELGRPARTAPTQTKGNAKAGSEKAQPDGVIFGADPPDADSGDASASKPVVAHPSGGQVNGSQAQPSKDQGSSGQGGKN